MKILKSRTFWTVAIMFVFNGLQAIKTSVSPNWQVGIDGALSLMALYFKMNPSQEYGK